MRRIAVGSSLKIHQSSKSPTAGEVLRRIAGLYRIEDEIRGQPPDARQAVRCDRCSPNVEAAKVYLEEQPAGVSGKMRPNRSQILNTQNLLRA
jgi:hypothetical protein